MADDGYGLLCSNLLLHNFDGLRLEDRCKDCGKTVEYIIRENRKRRGYKVEEIKALLDYLR